MSKSFDHRKCLEGRKKGILFQKQCTTFLPPQKMLWLREETNIPKNSKAIITLALCPGRSLLHHKSIENDWKKDICLLSAPDLGGSKGPGPHQQEVPHHVYVFSHMSVTTCACHVVIVISEESLFVDAINYRSSRRQYFTWILFDSATKQLLHLLFFWKSVRDLNLVSARSSQVKRISFRLYSLLVDFGSWRNESLGPGW